MWTLGGKKIWWHELHYGTHVEPVKTLDDVRKLSIELQAQGLRYDPELSHDISDQWVAFVFQDGFRVVLDLPNKYPYGSQKWREYKEKCRTAIEPYLLMPDRYTVMPYIQSRA